MNVKEIAEKWLEENGYDGLCDYWKDVLRTCEQIEQSRNIDRTNK